MSFIQWQDYMLTGNAKIDREHREIFSLVNRLGESIEQARWQSARIVGLRLFLEVCSHFEDEEALMAAHAYPGLEAHRRLHERCEGQMGHLDSVLSWTELRPADVTQSFREFVSRFDLDFFQADLHFVAYLAERRG